MILFNTATPKKGYARMQHFQTTKYLNSRAF